MEGQIIVAGEWLGQQIRLVIAALAQSLWVQRNRNDPIDRDSSRLPALGQECGKRRGDILTAGVLQRVNRLFEKAGVRADDAKPIEG
ncbi:MAG: hypothetical protein M5U01_25435 [Ardenticatenaceae bacterium]|nr:hypothetical protein [Ardenticatenaceae bacterium]HBY95166.1 hypothetical protein [Chloroflexota bacterium]